MGMEELKSMWAEAGSRRSRSASMRARNDPVKVIDLDDDDSEEEEDWEPKSLADVKVRSVGTSSNPISFRPMFERNIESTGLGECGSTRDALRCTGIDWTAAPQATEGEKKLSYDKYSMRDALRSTGIILNAAPQAMEGETKLSNDKKNEISRATGIDLDDPLVLDAIMDDDIAEISFRNFNLQQAEIVDLSSSESDDEGDGDDNGDIAEEPEEIVTFLSREDAVTFAEVMKTIKEGGDLRKFKMDQLKTYLRHHGLRMVGTKFVLLRRIQEHQRIKDRGREIYPVSSFSNNCKGDVCLGDSVLFLQTVYDMPFDYDRRCARGPPLGMRWVAGKVVSESYGARKQQHTFTIEVLWSAGTQPHYCMRPVMIKGRNLYRMATMRQPWSNEADRQMELDKKHARGEAARAIRRARVRLVKRLKSIGKFKAESKAHPYSQSLGEESNVITQETTRQYAGIHDRHQSSIPAHIAPTVPLHSSMQHGPDSERTFNQVFAADNHPAPPTNPGSSSHTRTRTHVQEFGRIRTRRQTSSQHLSNQDHHQQEAIRIPCSNTNCGNVGALRCIMRSCGQCCIRITNKGRCRRHK